MFAKEQKQQCESLVYIAKQIGAYLNSLNHDLPNSVQTDG